MEEMETAPGGRQPPTRQTAVSARTSAEQVGWGPQPQEVELRPLWRAEPLHLVHSLAA